MLKPSNFRGEEYTEREGGRGRWRESGVKPTDLWIDREIEEYDMKSK